MRGFPGQPDQLRACARRRSSSAPLGPGCQVAAVPGSSHPPAPGPWSPHLRAASLASPERPSAPRIPAHTAGPSVEPQSGSREALAS